MTFKRRIIIIILILGIVGIVSGQVRVPTSSQYPRSGERYITDEDGIIKMWVNVWGQVNDPGSHLVYDGIDLSTLLSITGGPKTGANLKKIRLFRELPDANGQLSLSIDLEKFLKSGDRGDFTRVLPNDTFIVPQSPMNYIISNLGIINTLMNVYNLLDAIPTQTRTGRFYQG